MTLPILRLEIDHMKHAVMTALHDYAVKMDKDIQEAVKAFCTPDNIRRIVFDEASRCMDEAIREEMRNFYTRGEGRKYVRQQVEAMLSSEFPHA